MYATKEEFAAAKVHSVIMVQGNPGPTFTVVGSAHRLWGTEPTRVEVFALPHDNDPPPVQVKRFAGTKQEYSEDAPDPVRIGLRSLREMKLPGSRLSIWGDGESVGQASSAMLATAIQESTRVAEENVTLKTEVTRLTEELESALAEIANLKIAAGAAVGTPTPTKTETPPAPAADATKVDDKGKSDKAKAK